MSTGETKLYCIQGLIKAAESSAKDPESYEALKQELKKNHILEHRGLITDDAFCSIMADRCDVASLAGVVTNIITEYEKFSIQVSVEKCMPCPIFYPL